MKAVAKEMMAMKKIAVQELVDDSFKSMCMGVNHILQVTPNLRTILKDASRANRLTPGDIREMADAMNAIRMHLDRAGGDLQFIESTRGALERKGVLKQGKVADLPVNVNLTWDE